MQIANRTDKEIEFAGQVIKPKSSISIHNSFITDDDLANEEISFKSATLVIFGDADGEQTDNDEPKLTTVPLKSNEDTVVNDGEPSGSNDTTPDYDSMSYDELKGLIKERGLKPDGKKKEDYIKALKADDESKGA